MTRTRRSVLRDGTTAIVASIALSGCSSSGSEEDAGVEASLTAEPTEPGVGEELTLDATGSTVPDGEVTSYEWDLDDGTQFETERGEISYGYSEPGTYGVEVTVSDGEGTADTATVVVTVSAPDRPDPDEVPPPTAELAVDPTEVSVGEQFTLDASGSSAAEVELVEFRWDLDDGTQFETERAEITYGYGEPGTYEISVTVVDEVGGEDTATATVEVESPE